MQPSMGLLYPFRPRYHPRPYFVLNATTTAGYIDPEFTVELNPGTGKNFSVDGCVNPQWDSAGWRYSTPTKALAEKGALVCRTVAIHRKEMMETAQRQKITIEVLVKAPIGVVWRLWTTPADIIQWNNASDDWHTPSTQNDLKPGGKFLFRMEAKDGSFGFDFAGVYDKVESQEFIAYTMGDGRRVEIDFTGVGTETKVVETFEAESQNSIEMQRDGWRAILNNFKKYAETRS